MASVSRRFRPKGYADDVAIIQAEKAHLAFSEGLLGSFFLVQSSQALHGLLQFQGACFNGIFEQNY